jgi:hypothetical protein
MKQLAAFWSGTPHWIRGLFLGNFFYIVVAVLIFISINNDPSEQSWITSVLAPFMLLMNSPIDSRVILYHIAWCLLGAVFVEWAGGPKGITLLAGVMYGIGVLLFVCLIATFLLSF